MHNIAISIDDRTSTLYTEGKTRNSKHQQAEKRKKGTTVRRVWGRLAWQTGRPKQQREKVKPRSADPNFRRRIDFSIFLFSISPLSSSTTTKTYAEASHNRHRVCTFSFYSCTAKPASSHGTDQAEGLTLTASSVKNRYTFDISGSSWKQ